MVLSVKYRWQHCSDTLTKSILPVHEPDNPHGGALAHVHRAGGARKLSAGEVIW